MIFFICCSSHILDALRVKLALSSVLERPAQIELYRVLQNLVAKFTCNSIEHIGVRFEQLLSGELFV